MSLTAAVTYLAKILNLLLLMLLLITVINTGSSISSTNSGSNISFRIKRVMNYNNINSSSNILGGNTKITTTNATYVYF